MPIPTIDWRRIRPFKGSQHHGFEELCCQLADAEGPRSSRFVRKGTPDAGVECYAAFADGSEAAWQAKYFVDSFGDTQWRQLDDSVKTALDKHLNLARYVICLPLDLADARIQDKRSAADRWTEHVSIWSDSALARGLAVSFELWGSYELAERLSRPENAGRLRYWFDATVFTEEWFDQRLTEALKAAGPRYSPEIHVDLPIAKSFDALGRTPNFFNAIKSHAKGIRRELSSLSHETRATSVDIASPETHEGTSASPIAEILERVTAKGELVLAGLRDLSYQPAGELPMTTIARDVAIAVAAVEELTKQLSERESTEREKRRAVSASARIEPRSSPLSNQRAYSYRLSAALRALAVGLEGGGALAMVEKSPWIAVAVSVREAYEPLVIPAQIRETALSVEHLGFAEREFDAIKTFFHYYGLDQPASPLLLPEYRNPLFLKMLCRGLRDRGETRVPRGMEGISATFGMYLTTANETLARSLGYNPKSDLVGRAIDLIADSFAASGKRWLSRANAEEIINSLLPGRTFDQSLYAGLVADGILAEELAWQDGGEHVEVTIIGYERLSDHLCAKRLLDLNLDAKAPELAFSAAGPLAYLADPEVYVQPGLLEALCLQIPERTGRELSELAPRVEERYSFASSFRQSLAWRAPTAFSRATYATIGRTTGTDDDLRDTVDTLLSLTGLPDHPLNADYLDKRLRRDSMAVRDGWWSTSLHRLWGRATSLDRLIDWAWSTTPEDVIDDAALDLCSVAIAWLFTSSNRYLRDRATTALVRLLTGRLAAVGRLVSRFADVDDVYVVERVVAVAYGCALRSYSPAEVGALAATVSERIFASRPPRPHILLRDYARGVVERALDLGWGGAMDARMARPPYGGAWPVIPSDAEITKFREDWTTVSYDGGQPEWARNRIANSVLDDDFARYVIGTNSRTTNFLSLRLSEPPWESARDRFEKVIGSLAPDQREVWNSVDELDASIRQLRIVAKSDVGFDENSIDTNKPVAENSETLKGKLNALHNSAWKDLAKALDPKQLEQLILSLKSVSDERGAKPPEFDLAIIQRYVLARVFELGWTTDLFGTFDRFEIGYDGRDASKAERIGKKYQWIAFHEIMALVADNFQYREWSDHFDSDRSYEGPWQEFLRDIDPSCALRSTAEEESSGTEDGTAWWSPYNASGWDEVGTLDEWVRATADLPDVGELLRVSNPNDQSQWLNLDAYKSWQDEAPPDRESYEIARRNLWLMARAFLVKEEQADAFMTWAATVDFMGRWMPDPPTIHRMFLGEHEWSPAARYFARPYYGDAGWVSPKECPTDVRCTTIHYLREASGFDCSIDSSFTLRLPCSDLMAALKCRWAGRAARFVDDTGAVVALDPSAEHVGPGALLVASTSLRQALAKNGLTICWAVLGEKRILTPGFGSDVWPAYRSLTGAYRLTQDGLSGFLNGVLVERSEVPGAARRSPMQRLSTRA